MCIRSTLKMYLFAVGASKCDISVVPPHERLLNSGRGLEILKDLAM